MSDIGDDEAKLPAKGFGIPLYIIALTGVVVAAFWIAQFAVKDYLIALMICVAILVGGLVAWYVFSKRARKEDIVHEAIYGGPAVADAYGEQAAVTVTLREERTSEENDLFDEVRAAVEANPEIIQIATKRSLIVAIMIGVVAIAAIAVMYLVGLISALFLWVTLIGGVLVGAAMVFSMADKLKKPKEEL